jgi:hypothetical protein
MPGSRESRRQQQEQAVVERLAAYHEAGHAVASEILGYRVLLVRLRKHGSGGATWHRPAASDLANAVILWAGAVAEALLAEGPESPESWGRQPDAADLRRLPPEIARQGFDTACAMLLSNPDTAAAVRAVADRLLVKRVVRGGIVRSLLHDPLQPEPTPDRRRRRTAPPPEYVRRSMGF